MANERTWPSLAVHSAVSSLALPRYTCNESNRESINPVLKVNEELGPLLLPNGEAEVFRGSNRFCPTYRRGRPFPFGETYLFDNIKALNSLLHEHVYQPLMEGKHLDIARCDEIFMPLYDELNEELHTSVRPTLTGSSPLTTYRLRGSLHRWEQVSRCEITLSPICRLLKWLLSMEQPPLLRS